MALKAQKVEICTEDRLARDPMTDHELVIRIRNGQLALFEVIMRRYNQRLFRIARGILRDDGEAEEVVQDSYIRAYEHLDEFQGPHGFSGWLSRIAINQALMRARRADWQTRQWVTERLDDAGQELTTMDRSTSTSPTPEDAAYQNELRVLLQQAIDALPDPYRLTFMMREVEQMSVRETAACLGIESATVKTRVFRARRMLRRTLSKQVRAATSEAFGFAGHRCDRIVARVLARLSDDGTANDNTRFHSKERM